MSAMPMLAYADASAAIDFLTTAFGFTERFRLDMPDGSVGHAELELEGAVIALAKRPRSTGQPSPPNLKTSFMGTACTEPLTQKATAGSFSRS